MNSPIYRFPGDDIELEEVDVAIVMESTYPYLKGGVSAVVHDIITHNPDLTFGILHIAWDSKAPAKDLYGVPSNVKWVDMMYLSLEETIDDFKVAIEDPVDAQRVARVVSALEQTMAGNHKPIMDLYYEAINPQTRTWRIWSVITHHDFMDAAVRAAGNVDDITLGELFWLVRDFFSLAFTLLERINPPAKVYHAHTTGYASLVGATAAIQKTDNFSSLSTTFMFAILSMTCSNGI